jgi:general secretion pathway protein I
VKAALRLRGFTLVEVLVALAIVALGAGAMFSVLTSSASATSYLREKSFAEWIGFDQISTTRLALNAITTGSTEGDVTFANQQWHWSQQIDAMEIPTMYRITVQVRRTDDPSVPKGQDAPWLATVIGFKGTALGASNGGIPNWGSTSGQRANGAAGTAITPRTPGQGPVPDLPTGTGTTTTTGTGTTSPGL